MMCGVNMLVCDTNDATWHIFTLVSSQERIQFLQLLTFLLPKKDKGSSNAELPCSRLNSKNPFTGY